MEDPVILKSSIVDGDNVQGSTFIGVPSTRKIKNERPKMGAKASD